MIRMFNLQVLMDARALVAVLESMQKMDYCEEREKMLQNSKSIYRDVLLNFSKLYPIDEVIL